LWEYCLRAFGTWAIFLQLREISITIGLDASHYLHNKKGLVASQRRRQAPERRRSQYLMWKVSSSAHSNDLKPVKTPKPIKLGLFKKNTFNPKTNKPMFFEP